ncbi:MAG TPA: formyltetrahydrofolate deformylase [Acidobacteriaceae bacterium]
MPKTAILLIDCPDRKGLVAAIANFLLEQNANILHADQHQDNALGLFFMRIEFMLDDGEFDEAAFRLNFAKIAEFLQMRWRLEYTDRKPKVALFVSQYMHCIADLLQRHKSGELRCEIPVIVGNHPDAAALAEFYGIPFHLIEVNRQNKQQAEAQQMALIEEHGVELIVLARYMQILSPEFCRRYPLRIINVHHSFLPAFVGAKPYHAAFARGVKLIGSTSHYVTEVLDDGPIIEQDVTRISHTDELDDLIQKGRDLERLVLSRAVRWHVERRVLAYANKTVIFS